MNRYVWTCPAERILRTEYPTKGGVYVADVLGITPKQVHARAMRLKIKTRAPRGVPFQSVDSRRGPGRPFKKKAQEA